MVKRKEKNDVFQNSVQLSLFENNERVSPASVPPQNPQKEPTVVDFIRAHFERNPDMTEEEYKR